MITFLKKEPVLSIAAIAAVISAFAVKPSAAYLDYIDFPVLVLLFCLMIVVAGLMETRLFDVVSSKLLKSSDNCRTVAVMLVNITFFSAMLITNDVALITLVPFTVGLYSDKSGRSLISLVVAETAAANLGSMMTPFGNPQNLYLYSYYNMSTADFFRVLLPYGLVSLGLINILTFFSVEKDKFSSETASDAKISDKRKFFVCLVLFILCVLAVLRFINVYICFAIVLAVFLIMDRRLFLRVDYLLLLTFCMFFVFVGNLGNIGAVTEKLSLLVEGNEFVVGVLLSQIISNVPAAIMLSGFTDNADKLLLGVNIGGLGTIVASLASVISYKQYSKAENADTKKYMLVFTLANIILLGILTGLYVLIK